MRLSKKRLLTMGATLALASAATSANALTFIGAQEFQGTGLGAVNTILTMQNTGTESASVGLDAGGNETFFAVAAPPVPEPSTYAMMGAGLLGLAWFRRRKNPK